MCVSPAIPTCLFLAPVLVTPIRLPVLQQLPTDLHCCFWTLLVHQLLGFIFNLATITPILSHLPLFKSLYTLLPPSLQHCCYDRLRQFLSALPFSFLSLHWKYSCLVGKKTFQLFPPWLQFLRKFLFVKHHKFLHNWTYVSDQGLFLFKSLWISFRYINVTSSQEISIMRQRQREEERTRTF